jgi:rod shape-determining protein MreC
VPRPRRSRRTWLTLAVLVLVSITVITLDERAGTHHLTSGVKSVASDIFAPIRRAVDDVTQPVGNFFAGMVNYGNLEQENAKLRGTIGRLQENAAEQSSAQRQLSQIQSLQHLAAAYVGTDSTVLAAVYSYDVSNFDATIDIDKGRNDGVMPGMPVVGNGGLVGRVTFASHTTAIVTLVTDGQSKVGVTFGQWPGCTTCWATAQGQGSGSTLHAEYVQPGTPVQKGEIMYTNYAQGGAFPTGIPVGRVASYKTVSGAAQMTILLDPAAELRNLSYVDVVQWNPPA